MATITLEYINNSVVQYIQSLIKDGYKINSELSDSDSNVMTAVLDKRHNDSIVSVIIKTSIAKNYYYIETECTIDRMKLHIETLDDFKIMFYHLYDNLYSDCIDDVLRCRNINC